MSELNQFLYDNWSEDIKAQIKCADDAIKQSFLFSQRWDMERTYIPVVFDGEIDFLHQPGSDPEWIFAFNRLKHFVALAQAWRLTGKEEYAKTLAKQIKHWIESVKSTDKNCEKAWRTIETGIRLDTFVKTYLLAKDSPSFKEIEMLFISSVKEHAEFILEKSWNSYHLMSNWGVLSNHGLYTAGCVFKNEEWRKEALRRLSLELKNEIYDDGVQWEQSPMYHNEVLRDYLDVILFSSMYCHELEPWFVQKVHKAALVNLKWVKPNGTEPMMGDSDDIDMRDLLTYSAFVFSDGNLKSVAYPVLDYETAFLTGMDGVRKYSEIEALEPKERDFFLSDSGNGIARTSWERDASYLRFHAGTLGAGHGHADQSHISFVYKGKDFLVDAGRYTYVFGDGRKAFKDNYAHNVVIVDKRECYPEKDSWECYSLDKAIGVRAQFKGSTVAFEGGHLAYIDKGVYAHRKVVWLKDKELLFVIDEMYASGEHSYEQIFHFAEDVDLKIEGNKAFAGQCTISQLSTSSLELSVKDSMISRHYNEKTDNKALVTSFSAKGDASLITIFDFSSDKGDARSLEVKSNFKGITFSSDVIEAVEVVSKTRDIVLVVAHKEYATPTDTFLAGGCTGFGQLTLFNRKEGETIIGERIFC